jgi:hypothetical protein
MSSSFKSKVWLAIGAVTVLPLAAAIALYAGAWTLFEATAVRRGSISYFFGVPNSIKQLPIIQQCTAPLYRWQGRDGESSPFVAVTYSSRASTDELVKAYDTSLKQAACTLTQTRMRGQQTVSIFRCNGTEFSSADLLVGSESPCASVELGFIQNY